MSGRLSNFLDLYKWTSLTVIYLKVTIGRHPRCDPFTFDGTYKYRRLPAGTFELSSKLSKENEKYHLHTAIVFDSRRSSAKMVLNSLERHILTKYGGGLASNNIDSRNIRTTMLDSTMLECNYNDAKERVQEIIQLIEPGEEDGEI